MFTSVARSWLTSSCGEGKGTVWPFSLVVLPSRHQPYMATHEARRCSRRLDSVRAWWGGGVVGGVVGASLHWGIGPSLSNDSL